MANGETPGGRRKQSHLLTGLWRTVERKALQRLFQLSWVDRKSGINTEYSESSWSKAKEHTSATFGKGQTIGGEGGGGEEVRVPGMGR